MEINHTTELTEAEVKIGNLTWDVGCMKSDKQIADIRLNGFEHWLESQAIKYAFNENSNYSEVLDVFKRIVRNEHK